MVLPDDGFRLTKHVAENIVCMYVCFVWASSWLLIKKKHDILEGKNNMKSAIISPELTNYFRHIRKIEKSDY